MKFNKRTEFMPLEPVHPTDLIMDEIEARRWNYRDVASQLDMTAEDFVDMLIHKFSINEPMAQKLEKTFGISASFWLNLQASYDKTLAFKNGEKCH